MNYKLCEWTGGEAADVGWLVGLSVYGRLILGMPRKTSACRLSSNDDEMVIMLFRWGPLFTLRLLAFCPYSHAARSTHTHWHLRCGQRLINKLCTLWNFPSLNKFCSFWRWEAFLRFFFSVVTELTKGGKIADCLIISAFVSSFWCIVMHFVITINWMT